jgi:lysozyme
MTELEIQRALLERGYDIGKSGADGIMGEATWAAISRAVRRLPIDVLLSTIELLPVQTEKEMKTSAVGRAAITQREGNVLTAYQDSVGVWTIGVGHTAAAGDPAPRPGMTITVAQSDEILSRDLAVFEDAVNKAVHVILSQPEFDALVSLAFNIGSGAFAKSTLVKKLNAGDRKGAADQFLVWNKAGGKVLKGLATRRAAERKQFLS